MPGPTITVSAVVLRDDQGRVLTVRKRGTTRFMLPGGKPEADESPDRTAVREIAEELGLELRLDRLELVGRFRSEAANEAGHSLLSTVYSHPLEGVPTVAAEIEEMRWLSPDEPLPADLAPMLEFRVLPALTSPLRTVTVFTGASAGTDARLGEAVAELATHLADHGIAIAYGGGHVGLMGRVADAALAAGGLVTGVIPQHLVDRELAHPGLTDLHVVDTMHQRKQRMTELGDAFVALPGGIGTLEELFEAWTWQQLGLHAKPVALYDVGGFWQPLLAMVDSMVDKGFLDARFRESLVVAGSPEELLALLRGWHRAREKWS